MKAKKVPADLHYSKESHVSAPVTSNMEWHLAPQDGKGNAKPDKVYKICMPAICTSTDDKGERYRQVGKPYVEDWNSKGQRAGENSRINGVADKMRGANAAPKRKGVNFYHAEIGSDVKDNS